VELSGRYCIMMEERRREGGSNAQLRDYGFFFAVVPG
jgi:hypothetical protein